MERLRESDGTPTHKRHARFHMARCRRGEAIHAALRAEMTARFDALKAKEREREDAEDAAVDADAEVQAAEELVENCVRDLDAAAASADRASQSLGAQKAIFPDGFGAVIDPDGEAQLAVLEPLRVRVAPFLGNAMVAAALAALNTAAEALEAALEVADTADDVVERLFAEELEARRAVRQQLESAHGRLRDHYKARPALAERYFLRKAEARRARNARKKKDAGAAQKDASAAQ